MIGSGIAGLSTAYELSQRGRSVIVIDRGPIAGGMTARTSAHLAPLCDDLMSEMQKIKGKEQSKLFYESQAAAVDRIEEIKNKEAIDCDFRRLDGYLFQGDGMPPDPIDEELDAVRAVGAPVDRLVGVPLNGCDDRHALRYPRQATFHPLKIWRDWSRRAPNARYNSSPAHRSRRSSRRTVQSPSRPRAALSAPLMLSLRRIRRLSIAWRCTPKPRRTGLTS